MLSETEFEALTETVSQKVTELCRDLAAGKIDIEPMKTRDRSACTYCQYKGICRFDTIRLPVADRVGDPLQKSLRRRRKKQKRQRIGEDSIGRPIHGQPRFLVWIFRMVYEIYPT